MGTQQLPAQVLFNRLIRTWIIPAANARGRNTGNPVILRVALIIWDQSGSPSVYFNEEAYQKVIRIKVIAAREIHKGQSISSEDLKGISKAILRHGLHDFPHIFVIQGKDQKFFLTSKGMDSIVGNGEFDLLAETLAKGGMELTSKDTTFDIFLDVIRNSYDGMSAFQKRREIKQLAGLDIEGIKGDSIPRARRYLRLPAFIALKDDEFLPLLIETRNAYIAGHFFSCIATGITTADRICNQLTHKYQIPAPIQRALFKMTLGQKIEKLRSLGVVDVSLEPILRKLNAIRTRHLHPKTPLRQLTLKRDSLSTIKLLHELLEGTFSAFKDYTIENGKFVPKPLV